jgi:hypothetical protein
MKEDIVFALLKDKAMGSKTEFKKQIKRYYKNVDESYLYQKITNYQIEKYGSTIMRKPIKTETRDGIYV